MVKRAVRLGILGASTVLLVVVFVAQGYAVSIQTRLLNGAVKPSGLYAMWWKTNSYPEATFDIFDDVSMLRNGYFERPYMRSTQYGVETTIPWWFVGMCWGGVAVPGWTWSRRRKVQGGFPVGKVAAGHKVARLGELVEV